MSESGLKLIHLFSKSGLNVMNLKCTCAYSTCTSVFEMLIIFTFIFVTTKRGWTGKRLRCQRETGSCGHSEMIQTTLWSWISSLQRQLPPQPATCANLFQVEMIVAMEEIKSALILLFCYLWPGELLLHSFFIASWTATILCCSFWVCSSYPLLSTVMGG